MLDAKGKKQNDRIRTFVKKKNYVGLKEYFRKHTNDPRTLIAEDILFEAMINLSQANPENLDNSFKIVQLLEEHLKNNKFFSAKDSTRMSMNNLYKYFNKLTDNDILAPGKLKFFDILGIDIKKLNKNIRLYEEKQNSKVLYKICDKFIEQKLCYKILFPEEAKFYRRLFRLPQNRDSQDVYKDLQKYLPDAITDLKKYLLSQEQNANTEHLIKSDNKIYQIIYERIALKATTQLHLDNDKVDKIFEAANTKKIRHALKNGGLQEAFSSLTPSHLLGISSLDLSYKERKVDGTEIENEAVDKYNQNLTTVLSNYLSKLEVDVEKYSNFPGKERIYEAALINIINIRDKLSNSRDARLLPGLLGDEAIKIGIDSNHQFKLKLSPGDDVEKLIRDKIGDVPEKDEKVKQILSHLWSLVDSRNAAYAEDLYDHQKQSYKQIEARQISNPDSKKLTEYEKKGIVIWKKAFDKPITQAEKELLAGFLDFITGNKEFNTKVRKLLRADDNFIKEYKGAIEGQFIKFTFKTNNLKRTKDIIEKLEKLIADIDSKKLIDPENRLSPEEIGVLSKFCEIDGIVKFINKRELNKISPELEVLTNLHSKGQALLSRFREALKENNQPYRNGYLVMDVARLYNAVKGHKETGFIAWVQDNIITKYSHAAVGLESQEGPKVSHVWKEYEKRILSATSSIYTDTFKILAHKLIKNRELKQKLREVYGDQWEATINLFFEQAAEKLHKIEANQVAMPNSGDKQTEAGVADFIPFGHKGEESIRKWAIEVLKDTSKIGEKFKTYNSDYVICSEFAAKMTLLALVDVETKIMKDIYSSDAKFKISDNHCFKLPFHEYEDLGKVHPERLIKLFSAAGAIEKIERSKNLEQMVRF